MTSEYPNPSELEQDEQVTHTADDDYVEEVDPYHRVIFGEVHEYEARGGQGDVLYTIENPKDTETEYPIRAAAIHADGDEFVLCVGEMRGLDEYDVTTVVSTYPTFHSAFVRARTKLEQ